jgi:hemolysin activation/secretion protein
MIWTKAIVGGRLCSCPGISQRPFAHRLLMIILCSISGMALNASAAGELAGTNAVESAGPGFNVQTYKVEGKMLPSPEAGAALFSKHTGTNVSLQEIIATASELQAEYSRQGCPNMTISVAPDRIRDSVVIMQVFQGSMPQILVSGKRYTISGNEMTATNASDVAITNAPTATTNATPHIAIEAYEVTGNDLLPDDVLQAVLSKYIGTNVSFDDIGSMIKELTLEYRDRGYDTVSVTTPVQRITNGIIKIQVFEGTLASITISGNRYFSSNNIMRALPGLKTNMILNSKLFQPELDRANANQDRQIYPQIGEGADPDTSTLTLVVKDRLPLHAKVEFNNQNSPDTPELRVNTSAVYNNLWQLEHSFGVQYSFSPQEFKQGDQWPFYDLPLVANYSAFYRLPLGTPGSVADEVAANPGSFGYSEATRKFNLPPPSGAMELNLYASRSTIDTGTESSPQTTILDIPGVEQITQENDQESLTVDETVGFRLSGPIPETGPVQSTWSSGLDFKTYDLTTFKTNNFLFYQITVNSLGNPNPPTISTVSSPVPVTTSQLQYLPFALRYDGGQHDGLGTTSFGLGLSVNTWFSGTVANLDNITGSTESHGHWVILTPSLSRDFNLYRNWVFSLRADGQWTSEPLISNEQFGIGGVASVRGYHEGEVFGDTGYHISAEQKTPPHLIGYVDGDSPFTLRGSIYMDYGEVFLLDPQTLPSHTQLWSAGFSLAGAVGTHWEAKLLFSWPFLSTADISAYQPQFGFALDAQF